MAEATKSEFVFERTFNQRDLASFLKEKSVSQRSIKHTASGTVKFYYCRNYRRHDCKFRVRCESSALSEAVDVYVSGFHDHSEDKSDNYFHPEIIEIVEKAVKQDRTPTQIGEEIKNAGFPKPTPSQLTNLAQRARKKVKQTGPKTEHELRAWCQSHQLSPNTGPHDVVMPIWDANQQRLHLTFTTPYLMSNCPRSPLFQVDATFKLNWHNHPCIVTGAQDQDRRFHPFMFHVVWKDEDTEVYNSIFQSHLDALQQFGLPAVPPRFVPKITAVIRSGLSHQKRD